MSMTRSTSHYPASRCMCDTLVLRVSGATSVHEMPMTSKQSSPTAAPTTRWVIDHFNETFNQHDADALAPLLTDDTLFEDTSPAPDGQRIEGKAAVIAFWREWFVRNPDAGFGA